MCPVMHGVWSCVPAAVAVCQPCLAVGLLGAKGGGATPTPLTLRVPCSNPFLRTHSHTRHREVQILNKDLVDSKVFADLSLAQKMRAHPPIFDNYMTRVLLGEAAYSLPSGGLNASHLQAAVSQLARFDLVLTLEAGPLRQTLLEKLFLWPDTDFDGRSQSRRRGQS